MLHTIRQIVDNDEKWRGVLRGLQSTFRHQTVTAAQIEGYMSEKSGIDFSKVFQQYLTTTKIPVLEYKSANGSFTYRWANVVPGFAMPVRANGQWLHPTEQWKTLAHADSLAVDPNFYVTTRNLNAPPPAKP
jgi:aminopeptidase N